MEFRAQLAGCRAMRTWMLAVPPFACHTPGPARLSAHVDGDPSAHVDGEPVTPHVNADRLPEGGVSYRSERLPALSADGTRVAMLQVEANAEAGFDNGAELWIIRVSDDKVVQRLDARSLERGDDPDAGVAAMNAYLDRDHWFGLTEADAAQHCPGGDSRDSDDRQCQLGVRDLTLRYAEPHLRVTRGGEDVIDRDFPSWSRPEVTTQDTDYGPALPGIADAWTDADERLLALVVTYHRYGDEAYGPEDEPHVLQIP